MVNNLYVFRSRISPSLRALLNFPVSDSKPEAALRCFASRGVRVGTNEDVLDFQRAARAPENITARPNPI